MVIFTESGCVHTALPVVRSRRFIVTFNSCLIHLDQQVVIVYFLALKRIVRRALNRICVSCASARNKISHAAMLVALIVVHVSGKHHDAVTERGPAAPPVPSLRLVQAREPSAHRHISCHRRNWCTADDGTSETQSPRRRERDRACRTATDPAVRPLPAKELSRTRTSVLAARTE